MTNERTSISRVAWAGAILFAWGAAGCTADAGLEDEDAPPATSSDALVTGTLRCTSEIVVSRSFFQRERHWGDATVFLRYTRTGNEVSFNRLSLTAEWEGTYSVSLRSSALPDDDDVLQEDFYFLRQPTERAHPEDARVTRRITFSSPRGSTITIKTKAFGGKGSCTVAVP